MKVENDMNAEKEEKTPIISVIIPCYNVDADMLKACIKSVSTQTFREFEVILVDDGSEEDYKNAIIEVGQSDDRIRILEQKNQGVSVARNNGVANAKGQFIIFVDADDIILPDFFSEILAAQRETGADFVIGGNMMLSKYHDGETLPAGKVSLLTNVEKEDFKQYILHVFYFEAKKGFIGRGPVSRLIKRKLVLETPFPSELSLGEDMVWNLELLSKNITVCLVYSVWYLYRQHGQSAVQGYNENIIKDLTHELEFILPWINLKNEAHYEAYCERIMENIRRVYINYFRRDQCPLSRVDKKKLFKYVYTQSPWTILEEKRFRKIKGVSVVEKFKSFLYAQKLYLPFLHLLSIIKRNMI